MGADSAPDDVGLTVDDLGCVFERGPTIGGPGHLEDARRALDAFHTQAFAEPATGLYVVDELLHSDEEGGLLARSELFEVRPEPGKPTVGGHAVQRFRRRLTGFAADRSPAINASLESKFST